MSKKRKVHNRSRFDKGVFVLIFAAFAFCFLAVIVEVVFQVFNPERTSVLVPEVFSFDTNDDVEQYVTEFFSSKDADEMVSIIACESEFMQFDSNGEVLKNRQGSSATGVAQIMESVHPDPSVIAAYNRQHDTKLTVDSFDINTIAGNVGYAYVLYKTRGTRDWECARKSNLR